MWFLSMGLCQGSGLCSSFSRKYPGTEGTNQNCHWNHHRWHATDSLELTWLSCWCLYNHKGCTYRAPVRYVTECCSVKKIHILLSRVYCVWQVVKTLTIISNNPVCVCVCILIIKTNEMHYFSNLFWYRTRHVSDRYCPSSGVSTLYTQQQVFVT